MRTACLDAAYKSSSRSVTTCLWLFFVLSILVCTVLTGRSRADCIDYIQHLRWIANADTPGLAKEVAVQGSYAYMTDYPSPPGQGGLRIVDISNPQAPTLVGNLGAPLNYPAGIAVSGQFVFVTDAHGLYVINVSNPASPAIVGSLSTPGDGRDVVLSGSYAYLCAGSGFYVIDVSNPASPAIIGSVNTGGNSVVLAGSYAFEIALGLKVIDISNPQSPTVVGGITMDQPADDDPMDLAISGTYLYMAEIQGLQVVDISSPTTPVLLGQMTSSQGWSVAVAGQVAYLTSPNEGVHLVDVSNPLSPTIVNKVNGQGDPYGIQLSGQYAYIAGSAGLEIIDLASPSPVSIGGVTTPGSAQDVAVSGSYAYISSFWEGLQVVDISNPTSPTLVGGLSMGVGPTSGVAVAGSYVYLDRLVIDVSNPASPAYISGSTTGTDVIRVGSYLYRAGNNNFEVLNISSPSSPQTVSFIFISAPFTLYHVTVSGHYAYVSGWSQILQPYPLPIIQNAGIRIIDISNPAQPVVVGGLDVSGKHFLGIAASGGYAYVADAFGGVQVIDVSNPTSPHIVGFIDVPGSPYDIKISGQTAYVAADHAGLQVIDISNPLSPELLGSGGTFGLAFGVGVTSKNVFIADGNGLEIFPIQCSAGGCSVEVHAGGPYTTCGSTCVRLSGESSDESVPVAWSTSGSGTFSPDETALDAVYCPSAADLAAGSVTLTLTAESCPSSEASLNFSQTVNLTALGVDPNTINTQSGGNYVTAYLEFPEGYDPAQVLLNSARLNGTVTASPDFFEVKDWNHNHIPDLAIKFARDAVQAALPDGDQVPISITGTIGQACFAGTTNVRLVRPHLEHPNGGETFYSGVQTLVEWENPQGWMVDYAQVYYSANGGDTWSLVADHITGTSYVWAAPSAPTENGRLRVVPVDAEGVMGYDSSDGPFTIAAATGIEPTMPTQYHLSQNAPNPFRRATRASFYLPVPERVAIEVVDLRGRVVRVLTDDLLPAGTHEVSWNGKDTGGNAVAGGIYFLHITAGSFSDTKRMFLQK